VPTCLQNDTLKTSFLANFNQAWSFLGHNATGFIEYYYNGFGESRAQPLFTELNTTLLNRISRNQVFTLNQHYADAGLTWEWTPLLTLNPTLMHNLQDQSGLILLNLNYSLSNTSQLLGGIQLPYGKSGTEFGGIYEDATRQTTLSYPIRFYLQFNVYF